MDDLKIAIYLSVLIDNGGQAVVNLLTVGEGVFLYKLQLSC